MVGWRRGQKIIASNWKMNGDLSRATDFARNISSPEGVFLILAPPFSCLTAMASLLKGKAIGLAGQNCHQKTKGAHTGEISATMLRDVGCDGVILGHSERRIQHDEGSELLAEKARAAFDAGLYVIFCVGESDEQREAGQAAEIVCQQIRKALPSTLDTEAFVIAYEPLWAIGTGKTAETKDIADMHSVIIKECRKWFGGTSPAILYGGSVKPENAGEILALESVSGVLVGGASLELSSFMAIAEAGARAGSQER